MVTKAPRMTLAPRAPRWTFCMPSWQLRNFQVGHNYCSTPVHAWRLAGLVSLLAPAFVLEEEASNNCRGDLIFTFFFHSSPTLSFSSSFCLLSAKIFQRVPFYSFAIVQRGPTVA